MPLLLFDNSNLCFYTLLLAVTLLLQVTGKTSQCETRLNMQSSFAAKPSFLAIKTPLKVSFCASATTPIALIQL